MITETVKSPLQLELSENLLIARLPEEWPVLSWAPKNGGFTKTSALLNLGVEKDARCRDILDTGRLDRLIAQHRLPASTVCFFTAARVAQYQEAFLEKEGAWVHAVATVGLSNARAAGDEADVPLQSNLQPAGTINLWVAANALPDLASMVEASSLAASAKTAALHQAGIFSRKSQRPAAGTGTDCTAIIASGEIKTKYCGLHTVVGELMGKAVFSVISRGISAK